MIHGQSDVWHGEGDMHTDMCGKARKTCTERCVARRGREARRMWQDEEGRYGMCGKGCLRA